jgi:hypothetical protein
VREIALHLLDIAENSIAAGAKEIEILVEEDLSSDRLRLMVQDNGRGMKADILAQVGDPFMTSRNTRKVGLGIPLLKAAAEACRGSLKMSSTPGRGTRLEVEFQWSHIDRMPLGDLAGTLFVLVIGQPQVHWLFTYRVYAPENGGLGEFIFDDALIKQTLGEIPLTEPEVLAYIRKALREGIDRVRRTAEQVEQVVGLS